jgi:subtilase family serine protease
MVHPKHSTHLSLYTGILSHVNIDSSIFADQVSITPSRATFSQAFTTITSQTFISSMSFSITLPQEITEALFAHSSSNFPIASHAFVFALYSKYLPRLIRVIIATAASK